MTSWPGSPQVRVKIDEGRGNEAPAGVEVVVDRTAQVHPLDQPVGEVQVGALAGTVTVVKAGVPQSGPAHRLPTSRV